MNPNESLEQFVRILFTSDRIPRNLTMSLGIAFKGPEGIVLSADSRVTLNSAMPQPNGQVMVISSTFDNATKLLSIKGQDFVGAVTYGVGAIGQQSPRTAHSYMPELEAELVRKHDGARLSVEVFSQELSSFFVERWNTEMAGVNLPGQDMVFLVGGYDVDAAYGRIFEFYIPSRPAPMERFVGAGAFGAVWGGQREYVDRLIKGYDPRVIDLAGAALNLDTAARAGLTEKLAELTTPIPYAFLPLQDCVDLSIFLIRVTEHLTIRAFDTNQGQTLSRFRHTFQSASTYVDPSTASVPSQANRVSSP